MGAGGEIGPGTRVGDVVVERCLGSGASGTVWLGRDTVLERGVALKVVDRRDAETDVLGEARLAGALQSPHIVTIHHIHTLADGRHVVEMELVDGGSLERLLRGGPLSSNMAAHVVRGVLSGLDRAHRAGIVHGDVKPENVLCACDGSVKLADFGLARSLGPRTGPRGVGGTPLYLAPEVLRGGAPSFVSDLWSVGVMLHRMLSGRLPFDGEDFASLARAVLDREAPPLDASVPRPLAELVSLCLEKDPARRCRSAAVALGRLDDHGGPRGDAEVEEASVRRRRVVVVEDEPQLRRLVRQALEESDYEVRDVAFGRDVGPAVREFRPDLVVLDLALPDMTGVEVLERLRASAETVPVLAMTGAVTDTCSRSLRPFPEVVMKPFTIPRFLAAVGRHAGRRPAGAPRAA